MANVYLAQGVNPSAILKYIESVKGDNYTSLHRLSVYQNNRCIAEVTVPPFEIEEKQQLFSLSKSYTSTAMGICYDRGLITLDTKIVDIFPDKVPVNPSEYLKNLTLFNIMTMSSGHGGCILDRIKDEDDIVKAFLACPIIKQPGTVFEYSTACTYIMSEIVTKLTGLSVYDLLSLDVFPKLGIEGGWFEQFNTVCNQGGVGMHASVDDSAKLVLLYANKGVWNGERILSEEWTTLATTKQIDNANNGTIDWESGYGFQFWMNGREGYRGDGAHGQISAYFPSKNLVVSIQSLIGNMQFEMDSVYEMVDRLFDESELKPTDLEEAIDALYELPYPTREIKGFDGVYKFEKNGAGITLGRFIKKDDAITFEFSNGERWQSITAGRGKYIEGTFESFHMRPMLYHLCDNATKDKSHFKAYYDYDGTTLKLVLVHIDVCMPYIIEFVETDDGIKCEAHVPVTDVPGDAQHLVAVKIR